jgi:general secretion pathway protein E
MIGKKLTWASAFLLATLFFLILPHGAQGDKLIFKTGSFLEGVILEESQDRIVFRTKDGNVAEYNRALVQTVQRDEIAPGLGAADVLERVAALRQTRDFTTALETLLKAAAQSPEKAGAFAETFKAVLFQLDAAIRQLATTDRVRARDLLWTQVRVLETTTTQLLVPSRSEIDAWLRTAKRNLAQVDYEIAVALANDRARRPEIRELLLESIALDPQNVSAHLYLANLALELGDNATAIREYQTVLHSVGINEEFKKQAEAGLQMAQERLSRGRVEARTATQQSSANAPASQPTASEPRLPMETPSWLKVVEQRLEAVGVMEYVRIVWRELSSGQYNAYLVGVPSFIFFFWLLPYWLIRYRSRRGDVIAGELREKAKRWGLIALAIYGVRVAKSAKPKNRCPFCNKSLDKLDAYTDLNFYACPHCHEPITPIYDLKDYIAHLVKQIELQLKHSKENLVSGVERDLMLRLVRAVVTLAVRKRASDLHLESEVDGAKLRIRVDGMMYDFLHFPRTVALAFISALKIMANLDITERRVPQDGKIGMWIDKTDLDLRINTSPAAMGEKVAIRILNPKVISVDPVKLGLDGENLERFERAIHRPHGMIIVTGPAGSGKSTTLYVALNLINTGEKNIVTLEDPIEYQIKGISQMQVNPATNFTFATGLRSILRQDPDVIMVGEIRDSETAEIAVEAALTGHLLMTTLHTIDCATAFARMADLGVDTSRMASALICIIAQRLVRTICTDCAKPYKPKREHLEQLNITDIPKDFTFIHGTGCDTCMNTGYCGRIGLFEFLMPDEQMREVLESAPPVSVIRELARKKGFASIKDEGLRRVWSGITTVEEVLRVTS